MSGYTKLFQSILASTIWRADDKTRIVWITLLAMADKYGVAEGSIPGLADMARVSIEDCERALKILESPDPYSRSKEHEGRRIRSVDEGWQLLNHTKYRERMSADDRREYLRVKQAEYRARNKSGMSAGRTSSHRSRYTNLDRPGFVYYAQSGKRVKIGWSQNPWARMLEFKTADPDMQLIGVEYGTVDSERQRQAQFEKERIEVNREWFVASQELLQFIGGLPPIDTESTTVNIRNASYTPSTHTEADTEAEAKEKTDGTRARLEPLVDPPLQSIGARSEHRNHAACGKVCVPAFLHREFLKYRGGNEDEADGELRAWYRAVMDRIGDGAVSEPDAIKFWRGEYKSAFPGSDDSRAAENAKALELVLAMEQKRARKVGT
jgi:hypothetical protein